MTDNAELQAEIERLRAENAQLRTKSANRGAWVRSTAVTLLIVLGTLLTVPGIAAPWLRNQLLDTDRWVETMDEIMADPDTIDYISARINTRIYEQVDVEAQLQQALPPDLAFAAAPLSGQVQSKTQDLIDEALSSAEFQELWNSALTNAHTSIITFLETGESETLSVNSNNMLVLNLSPIIERLEQRLVDRGLTFISSLPSVPDQIDVEIADASVLISAERAVRMLQVAAWLFPILAIGCFVAAVGLSNNRRRALTLSGLGLVAGAFVVGILLALGRAGFVNAADEVNMPLTVATDIFNSMVTYLRNSLRVVGLIGLLIALFALLTGPSDGATKLRSSIGNAITGAGERTGWDSGPVGRWLARHRGMTILGIAILGALIFLSVDAPSPRLVLVLVIVGLLLTGVALFVASAAGPADEDGEDGDAADKPTEVIDTERLTKADQT